MKLGQKVKDKITGFEGVTTGHCTYISGCDQWLVVPPAKDGDFKTAHWFDVQRLEVVGEETIVLDNTINPGSDIPAPIK